MEILGQAAGADGERLELRARSAGDQPVLEVWSDGRLVMSSEQRGSERELCNLLLAPLRDRNDVNVLLGGLSMGHLLRALLDDPRVVRVDVVEHSAALVEWNRTHFAALHREPPLRDPRVQLHERSVQDFLRALRHGAVELPEDHTGYLALVLDVDEGPSALSRGANGELYTEEGLGDLEQALRPGGVLGLWAAQREPELLARLRSRFQNLAELVVPVDVPGRGLDYIYRCRRGGAKAPAAAPASGGGAPRKNGRLPS